MSGKLLVQTLFGKSAGTVTVDASAGDLSALTALVEGHIEQYDMKSSGGTVCVEPSVYNTQKYHLKKTGTKFSCNIKIPHVKAGKDSVDVVTAIKGSFDCAWLNSQACDSVSLSYSNMKA
jgi:hypothetical protein